MNTRPKHSAVQNGMRLPAVAPGFLVPFSHPPAPRVGAATGCYLGCGRFDFVKGMGDSVSQRNGIHPVLFQGTDVLRILSLMGGNGI